jgi:alpha-ribazole phosphatase
MITFVRHAESVSNAGGITMPHHPIPLSPKGREQAWALAASLPPAPAAVLVSAMLRTHQTAAPYCALHNMAQSEHAALNEFSVVDESLIAGMLGPERRAFVRQYWESPDPHRRHPTFTATALRREPQPESQDFGSKYHTVSKAAG